MTKPSTFSRLATASLAFTMTVAVVAQDISGGAGVLLANADVEAKLGKGIFTPVPTKPHVKKAPDKRLVARSDRRTSTAGTRPPNTGNTSGNRNETGGVKPATGRPTGIEDASCLSTARPCPGRAAIG